MRKICFIAPLLLIFMNSYSQDTLSKWKKGFFGSLTFSNVKLDNWAEGGENSVSGMALTNSFCNFSDSNLIWDNTLDLGYGLIKPGESKVRKNEDKIDLNSKIGYKATGKLYYSLLFNFKSQFMPGYKYPNDSVVVSRFMAPGYLTLGVGIDYKPYYFLSVFISPVSGRLTVVADRTLADSGSYGVDKAVYENGVLIKHGSMTRYEFGALFRATIQKDFGKNKNLGIASTINLFNNYSDKVKSNRKNTDVNWETIFNIRAAKFLTASFFIRLIYDDDVKIPDYEIINGVKTEVGRSPKLQIKEVLGFGLSYKFTS